MKVTKKAKLITSKNSSNFKNIEIEKNDTTSMTDPRLSNSVENIESVKDNVVLKSKPLELQQKSKQKHFLYRPPSHLYEF